MLGGFLDRWLTGWRARALVAAGIVILIVLPPLLGPNSYVTQLLLTLFVFAVFGHAWNLLAGYCGLLSFGNQVYVGIAGFAMAILVYYGGVHVWVAMPIAGLVSAAFAFLLAIPVRTSLIGPAVLRPVAVAVALWIGYEILVYYDPWWDVFGDPYVRRVMILLLIFLGAMPLLTLEGAYFAVATWLIAAAVGTVFNEWKLVGAGGGMRIPSSVTLEEMYYVGLILLVFATWIIRALLNSRIGLALTAVRDDAEAAGTVGVDVAKVKLLAFVLSGALTGLAASLYFVDAVSLTPPSAFTVFWSAYFVFVAVAGGMGSLSGPIVGALIFVVIDRLLSGWLDQPLLVLGLASVIVILVLPRGVVGALDVLRSARDARSAWRELFEATALADLIGRLGRHRRARDGNAVVAAFLVPGTPLPLLRPDAPGWKTLLDGYREAARSLEKARPDVLLVYSTQWIAVLDQLWQTRPRVRGIHVDENWHAFGDLAYDFDIDAELAQACIDQSDDVGVRSKPVNYDRFPIDTGTIVAANLLNPESRRPLVLASNNLYHDGALTGRLAALAVQCAAEQGKRVALIGVGGLSGAVHRREIDPAEDSFAGDADDHWNRRLLDALIAGDVSQLRALLPDYAANARGDMGMKHLEWLLGGAGAQWRGAYVHAYGPVWGSGAAVVELALDDRLARRGRARGIPAEAKRRLTVSGDAPESAAEPPPKSSVPKPSAPKPSVAAQPAASGPSRRVAAAAGNGFLYRNFRAQAEIDAQYDVEASVEDFGATVEFFLSNSERVRRKLKPALDIAYGPTAAEHLDLYPARAPDAPLHLFIHGGYWHSLSSKEFSFVAEGLVEAGVAVAVLNYDLCPNVTMTEIVRQNRAAVKWLYENAARHNCDPERISVSGHSAGGHLTAMLMATDWAGAWGLPADVVKSGCAISGLFDLAPFAHSWLQPKLKLDAGEIARNSPILHIPQAAGPLIVTLGGDESAEFHRQSQDFLAAWTRAGLPGTYLDLPGLNHFTVLEGYMDRRSPLCSAILRQIEETRSG
ncbi:MAG: alpha/beta hydrolase fold domain-containing protein [Rhodospirillaceae bacterium]|nr:alpha/beta hydrolase fold domain-containing protein [Rhodospirillaceae bacterium]MYH35516.1 alpha/beta hydrolase fold domain-containing protein [Rhodospirillaceae bacterium]MYK14142.1 alpha/beta hydrolase fold domain-containing protein [Rhodospirillaceae bacterium]